MVAVNLNKSAALRLSGRSGVNGSLNEEFRWRGGEARAKSPSEVGDRVRYVRFAPCAAYSVPAVGVLLVGEMPFAVTHYGEGAVATLTLHTLVSARRAGS